MKTSVYLAFGACVLFFIDLSLVQPTLYPYVSLMCGSHNLYGWVQAVYILGQCLASLIFGAWASRRTVKEAFVITTGLMVVGNVMYAVAPTIGSPHGPCQPGGVCVVHTATQPCTLHVAAKWIVLSGRFVAGLGGGCLSVAYGFFPRVTAVQDRPTVFAQARTLQSLALILAPAIAGAFATMTCGCTAGTVISGNPYINQYTMPGIVTAVVSLMLLVGFMCLFRNPPPAPPSPRKQPRFNKTLVGIIVDMSVVSAVISAYTLGLVPTSKAEYGWSNLDNSLMFAVVGVIFVPGAWFAVWAAARVSSRFAILTGTISTLIGLAAPLMPQTAYVNITDASWYMVSIVFCALGFGIVTCIGPAAFAQSVPPTHMQVTMATLPFFLGIARFLGPLLAGYTYSNTLCAGESYRLWCTFRGTSLVSCCLVVAAVLFQVAFWRHTKTPLEVKRWKERAGGASSAAGGRGAGSQQRALHGADSSVTDMLLEGFPPNRDSTDTNESNISSTGSYDAVRNDHAGRPFGGGAGGGGAGGGAGAGAMDGVDRFNISHQPAAAVGAGGRSVSMDAALRDSSGGNAFRDAHARRTVSEAQVGRHDASKLQHAWNDMAQLYRTQSIHSARFAPTL